jgi:hypothetical protein
VLPRSILVLSAAVLATLSSTLLIAPSKKLLPLPLYVIAAISLAGQQKS